VLTAEQARDLLEIAGDRINVDSILLTIQVPVDRWHDMIGSPTIADANLDRLVHNGTQRREPTKAAQAQART
jgi:DNA replication protein DnaC